MSESAAVREQARSLYLKHRAAVELIYENRPDYAHEGKAMFRAAIEGQDTWVLDRDERELLFFRSADWDRFDAFRTGTGWENPGSLVTFGFDFRSGYPHLICTLGPGTDEGIRRAIHVAISQHPRLFSRPAVRLDVSYTRLDVKGPILDDADYDNWDDPAVRAKLTDWVVSFARNDFPRMNAVIVGCFREYEARQSDDNSSELP